MSPDEFMKNLDRAIDKTVEDLRPTMEEAALTGKALLAKRIQNSGFGETYISRAYRRLRARLGYEIRFVNLTFKGAMFRGWKEPSTERDNLIIKGRVGGTDLETRQKLNWNKSRYPNFDRASDEEVNIIKTNLLTPRIKEILEQNLFSR